MPPSSRGAALAMRRKLLGDEHVDVAISLYDLGMLLHDTERYAEAEQVLREALAIRRKLLGDEHEHTIRTAARLGQLLRDAGELNEAEALLREAVERSRVALGDGHRFVGFARCDLGVCLTALGRYDEAERELLEALRHLTAHYLTDDHPAVVPTVDRLAALYEAWGKPEEAIRWLEELESIRRRGLETALAEGGAEDFDTGCRRGELGRCLTRMARYAEAEEQLLEAHRVLDAAVGDGHIRTIRAVRALVDLHEAWHAAEPDQGYDVKAGEWQAKLVEQAH
ncbi:MAG: tetratricopeptide repeat protein [Planctomycetes bacterium]|nr:tetratricopeptide repeat protein [Planctomycetota bacterium]